VSGGRACSGVGLLPSAWLAPGVGDVSCWPDRVFESEKKGPCCVGHTLFAVIAVFDIRLLVRGRVGSTRAASRPACPVPPPSSRSRHMYRCCHAPQQRKTRGRLGTALSARPDGSFSSDPQPRHPARRPCTRSHPAGARGRLSSCAQPAWHRGHFSGSTM